jgi:hypothetical protein
MSDRDRVGRASASPLARRMAKEAGIDLAGVTGSGPNGRILASDIAALVPERVQEEAVTHTDAPEMSTPAQKAMPQANPPPGSTEKAAPAAESRSPVRILTILSLCVAMVSMLAAAYQSYSHGRNLEVIQRNVLRAEALRTCREIIEVYFLIRMKAGLLTRDAQQGSETPPAAQRIEAQGLVYRFGGLGTFLANFRDETVRERYTQLSWQLLRIVNEAPQSGVASLDKLYEPADALFTTMNEDCASSARLYTP